MGSLYSEHRTWLHGVPASFKLLALAMLSTGLFLTDRLLILGPAAALCAVLFLSLGAAMRPARRLVLSLLIAALLVALFHVFMGQSLLGLASALRLLGAALLGFALTLTTRYTELLDVFERWLAPLGRVGIRVDRLSLKLALMMRFTGHFFVQWKRLDDAHRARTGRPGGFRLLAPLTIQMLVSAGRVADALQLRLGE